MDLRDPAGMIACALGAVVCGAVAVVAWRRRAHNLALGAALTVVMAGACWWAVELTAVRVSISQTVTAIAMLTTFAGPRRRRSRRCRRTRWRV